MRTYSIPFVLVLSLTSATFLSTACDSETSRTPLQPTGISSLVSTSEFAAAIRPTRLERRSVAGALCPLRHPFFVPLELFVENTSASTVFLNRVGFQFIDSFGVVGPQIVTGQDTLLRRFGHVGLPPDSSRVFPFSVEFGCGTLPHGKINVAIETLDARRTPRERTFTVFVR
jgi:hypothetical protein